MSALYFLMAIPFLRGLIFFFDWRFFVKVCNEHEAYLKRTGEDATDEVKSKSLSASEWLTGNLTEIKRRVEKAGIDVPVVSFMEHKGYNYVGEEKMNILDNLLYLNKNVQHTAMTVLKRTRGHYKNQAIRSVNPLFWIEVLFYLPKAIVSASGLDASSKIADTALKLTQVVYWVLIVGMVILKPELFLLVIEQIKPK